MALCDIADRPEVDEKTMRARNKQAWLLVLAVVLAYTAQMMLTPIIAPMSRKEGLDIWEVGATLSVAAILVFFLSPRWMRYAVRAGRKKTLMRALFIGFVSMVLFATLVQLALAGIVSGWLLFALFFLFRGVGFGIGIAAVLPVAQSYIAIITTDHSSCMRGMSRIASAQSFALIAGAIVSGLLVTANLAVPIMIMPIVLLIAFLLVWLGVKEEPEIEHAQNPPRLSVLDKRVRGYLMVGFPLFIIYGMLQLLIGFIVQDAFKLPAQQAAMITGGVLIVFGAIVLSTQLFLIPRLGLAPSTVLRVGVLIMASGIVVVFLVNPVIGVGLINLGMAFVMPGYTAGATLAVERAEQGALAGLIGAGNGVAFAIAPLLGTLLYAAGWQIPFIIGAIVVAVALILLFTRQEFNKPRND